ncbi:MAG: UDP-3-O-(3-hydroxymyristoyl)glucosamine N-acyltransferase [Deltaproteobacteria bacterium]|nr:MAG: UDP-3-O-(3-hydroxymyristoyl)glucosamine N-acyltransferase [Deltaproteobacteria bacterium]
MEKTLEELANYVGGEVIGDKKVKIKSVGSIDGAIEGQIAFIASTRYLRKLNQTEASAIVVPPKVKRAKKPILVSENPYLAWAKIATMLSPEPQFSREISRSSTIAPSAKLGKDLSIYPFVYVGERVEIDDRVVLMPGVWVGDDSRIGEDSVIYANASIYPGSGIGKRVIIHSGAVIGSDGFGFVPEGKKHFKIPQRGVVVVEDDVEIGANVTIDRATLGKTIIKKGTKIDNLVQIGHNVIIGENCIIVAQVGISGSTKLGNNVILAGQVGVSDHVKIGDNVVVGAKSGVSNSIAPNRQVSGIPTIAHRDWLRAATIFGKLPELRKTLRELEKKVKELS